MAASVRIEDEAFSDTRLELLGGIAGYNRFEALGRMAHLWRLCTQRQLHVVSEAIVAACLGPKGVEALIGAELGEATDGGIRVRGTTGRIEWLEDIRRRSKKGGEANRIRVASLKGADREPTGSDQASQDGAKGEPNRSTPAPAPAPAKESEISPDWRSRASTVAERIWYAHCDRHAALFPDLRPKLIRLPTTQGYREIRARAEDYAKLEGGGLEQFEADAMHVIEVQEADARAKRDARYFGEGMWRAQNFATAKSMRAPQTASAVHAREREFVGRSGIPDHVWSDE